MRKFTKLWQLMIVLLLTSSVAMAQKTTSGLQNLDESSLSATFEKPYSNIIYDKTKYPTPKQGGDDIATATVIDAIPYADNGTTDGYTHDYDEECPYTGSTSPDVVYSYTPAADEDVVISLCNDGTAYDTKLYVYDTPTPTMGDAIACNDDFCETAQSNYVSEIELVSLTGGTTYYIVVDGYGGASGVYFLTINPYEPPPGCVWGVDIECPAGSIDETEACGEDLNGGCNMTGTQLWEPVPATGGTICGTTWADASSRDTDWYELVLDEAAPVIMTANSDQLIIYGPIADAEGNIINPNCGTASSITPNNNAGPCDETSLDLGVLEAGTYWFFVGMTVYEGFPCDVHYYVTFDIGGASCPAPTALGVNNLTETTADLEWTSTTGLSNLEFGLQGFTVGVDPIVSVTGVTSPYMVSDLVANDYDFYVQDDCGAGDLSDWAGPFTFTFTGEFFEPPTDLTYDLEDNDVTLNWTAPSGGGGLIEIAYDDGTSEQGFSVQTPAGDNDYIAVRFTAPEDGTIEEIAIATYVQADAKDYADVIVCPDNGSGAPDLASAYENFGTTTVTANAADWIFLTLTSPFAVSANDDFWVTVTWPSGATGGPYVGSDNTTPPTEDRNYWSNVPGAWNLWPDHNFMFRSYYSTGKSSIGELTVIPVANAENNVLSTTSLMNPTIQNNPQSYALPKIVSGSKALTGYNVYRNDAVIASPTETTYADMDLAPGDYNYYVTAVYDGGESTGSNHVDVNIPSAGDPPTNVTATKVGDTDIHVDWNAPGGGGTGFFEDFEGGVLPTGWLAIDNDGDGFNWINTIEQGFGFDAYEGDGAMTSASYDNTAGALTPDNYLITPAIEIGAGSVLSYWHDAQDPNYADDFYYVKLSTTGTGLADFTETLWSGVTPGDWAEVTIDLSAYAGNTCYIAFHHTECTDWFWMKLDNVSVSDTKSQSTPTPVVTGGTDKGMPFRTSGMTADEINEAYASYSIKSTKDLLGYKVYRNGSFLADVTETEYDDLGLADGDYTYCVTAIYTEGESDQVCSNTITIGGAAGEEFCEDFDDLTVGGYVALQLGGLWTTWSNAPGTAEDGLVSDMYSASPSNSILIEGTTDQFLHFTTEASITSGVHTFSHYMYIPSNKTGYWNLQKTTTAGEEWGFQIMYDDDGLYYVDAGAAAAVVMPYENDTWYYSEIVVDLDNDWCEFYIDDALIIGYQWTLGTFGTPGLLSLGGANLYANPGAGGTLPGAHFDNVCFDDSMPPPPGPCDDFDDLTVGGYVADQLGGMWTTWSGAPGSSEDAFVTDAQSNSPSNSFVIDDGGIDLVRKLSETPIDTGLQLYTHYMYVPAGFSGYFNVQTDPTPGTGWVVDLFFSDDGTGHVDVNQINIHDFTYTPDTWIFVEINFDMINHYGEIRFDQNSVVIWENSLTIGGIDYWGWTDGGTPGAHYDDVCFLLNGGWVIIGIEETAIEQAVSVFPNPATDIVNIQSDVEINNVKVYNNIGQLISDKQVNSKLYQVNTSQFEAGLYFFQVETNDGVVSKRIIIQ
jgi:hypothetical protein